MAKNGFCVDMPMRDDAAFLHVRQQHVLLSPIEAMQFIDEQDGAPAVGFQFMACLLE